MDAVQTCRIANAKRQFIDLVRRMKPGEHLAVDCRELRVIPPYEYNGATFTAADQILENIVGSSYEYGYVADQPRPGYVEFFRLLKPTGDMVCHPHTYKSPDRRKESNALRLPPEILRLAEEPGQVRTAEQAASGAELGAACSDRDR